MLNSIWEGFLAILRFFRLISPSRGEGMYFLITLYPNFKNKEKVMRKQYKVICKILDSAYKSSGSKLSARGFVNSTSSSYTYCEVPGAAAYAVKKFSEKKSSSFNIGSFIDCTGTFNDKCRTEKSIESLKNQESESIKMGDLDKAASIREELESLVFKLHIHKWGNS